jgi:MoxR-like ATPase
MNIKIKQVATAKAATKVIRKLLEENQSSINAMVLFEQKGAGIFAYLEEINPANQIGKVAEGLAEVPKAGTYSTSITGVETSKTGKNIILVKLNLNENEGVPVPQNEADYSALFQSLISSGISTDGEINSAVKIMEENNVHCSIIQWVMEQWEKRVHVHKTPLVYKNQRSPEEESFLTTAIIAFAMKAGLVLEGPKATGKNVFAETCAEVLHLPYYRLNFTRDMLLEDIFGSKSTDNRAAEKLEVGLAKAYLKTNVAPQIATNEDWEKASQFELLKAQAASLQIVHSVSTIIEWAKEGGVLMLDEMNMADPNMLQQIVNPIADTERVLLVPGEGEIPLNKSCFVLASMNPGYAGTSELNEATASRLGVLKFEYGDSILESLKANFNRSDCLKYAKYFEQADIFYRRCKTLVEEGSVTDRVLNVRGIVHALEGVIRFPFATTLNRQLVTWVVNGCETDEQAKVIQILDDSIPDCR